MVKDIQAVKDFEHGTVGMDFGEPDSPEFRAWLEAVLSGDRKRSQDWYLNRLERAVFEFALDPNLKRTSDGVSVDPAKPQADDNANDRYHRELKTSLGFPPENRWK